MMKLWEKVTHHVPTADISREPARDRFRSMRAKQAPQPGGVEPDAFEQHGSEARGSVEAKESSTTTSPRHSLSAPRGAAVGATHSVQPPSFQPEGPTAPLGAGLFLPAPGEAAYPILPQPPGPFAKHPDATIKTYIEKQLKAHGTDPGKWPDLDPPLVALLARYVEITPDTTPAHSIHAIAAQLPPNLDSVAVLQRLAHGLGVNPASVAFAGAKLTQWRCRTNAFCRFEAADQVLKKVDALSGLDEVKSTFHDTAKSLKIDAIKRQQGISVPSNWNATFVGRAGTGKTTVVKHYAELLQSLGVLRRGHIVSVTRADLVGNVQGKSAQQTREKLEQAKGGVLFIDEAYNLVNGDQDSYGREVITTLLPYLEEHSKDLVVVLAGYPDKMRSLFAANEGLESRMRITMNFPDMSNEQLCDALQNQAKALGYVIDTPTLTALLPVVEGLRGPNFGNARSVLNKLQDAIRRYQARSYDQEMQSLITGAPASLRRLTLADFVPQHATSKADVSAMLTELGSLDTSGEAAKAVRTLHARVVLQAARLQKGLHSEPLHYHANLVSTDGDVTRQVADVYARSLIAAGTLPPESRVEHVGAGDLVAGYVGQTADKTRRALETAQGGVVVIQNAQELLDSQYGKEALATVFESMQRYGNRPTVILCADEAGANRLNAAYGPGLRAAMGLNLHLQPKSTQTIDGEIAEYLGAASYELESGLSTRQVADQYQTARAARPGLSVETYLQEAMGKLAVRLESQISNNVALDDSDLTTLHAADFQ